MEYRSFGGLDLQVSDLGLGCARLGGGFQPGGRSEALATIASAFDQGITYFDTADMYNRGESEKLIGEALRGNRGEIVVATKVGYRIARSRVLARVKRMVKPNARPAQDFSASYIVRSAEGSLKRLGTDYLDVYQLHSPPMSVVENGSALGALEQLRQQGKVRIIGVACDTVEDAITCLQYPQIQMVQVTISLLNREAWRALLPLATEKRLAVVAREVFAGGLLTRSDDAWRQQVERLKAADQEWMVRKVDALRGVSDQLGRGLGEIALQSVVGLPGVSVALLGVRTPEQLSQCVAYGSAPRLGDTEQAALRAAL